MFLGFFLVLGWLVWLGFGCFFVVGAVFYGLIAATSVWGVGWQQ
jgi:hypothetical protein